MNEVGKHQDREGEEMQAFNGIGQALVVAGQATKAGHPSVAALDDPAAGQQDKALFRLGQLDHDQANTLCCSGLFRHITRIALVHKRHLDRVIGGGLDLLGQFGDLRPILLIGRGDMQGQQIPQRSDRQMNLAAFPAFGASLAGPRATFRRGLQRPTVKDGCRWVGWVPLGQAQQRPPVLHQRLKAAGFQPALGLLLDRVPGRPVMRPLSPLRSRAYDPVHAVERFAQTVVPLRRIVAHPGQIRCRKRPFVIPHITWLTFSFHVRTLQYIRLLLRRSGVAIYSESASQALSKRHVAD